MGDTPTSYLIRVRELVPATIKGLRGALPGAPDQTTAARLGGIGRQQLSDYERGESLPSLEILGRFLHGWGLTMADFEAKLAEVAGEKGTVTRRLDRIEEKMGLGPE